MLAAVLRLLIASVAFFVAWSWLRAGFTAETSGGTRMTGSMLLLRGGAFAAALVWWTLAVTDMVGWIFGLAIIGGVTWFLNARAQKADGKAGSSSSSSPPSDDGDA
jgi:hypothetical protein